MIFTKIERDRYIDSLETLSETAILNEQPGIETGYVGMALPENILAYSIAIRGVRHTYRKIGQSINR